MVVVVVGNGSYDESSNNGSNVINRFGVNGIYGND